MLLTVYNASVSFTLCRQKTGTGKSRSRWPESEGKLLIVSVTQDGDQAEQGMKRFSQKGATIRSPVSAIKTWASRPRGWIITWVLSRSRLRLPVSLKPTVWLLKVSGIYYPRGRECKLPVWESVTYCHVLRGSRTSHFGEERLRGVWAPNTNAEGWWRYSHVYAS